MTSHPVTIEEVLKWLEVNRKNAAWLAKTLGVSQSTPSRWSKGDPIPATSQHLLRLLIRGEVPAGFSKPVDPAVLGFTPQEWRIIEICRVREGFPDGKSWIAAKIRAYLAMTEAVETVGPKLYHEPPADREERLQREHPDGGKGNGTEGK